MLRNGRQTKAMSAVRAVTKTAREIALAQKFEAAKEKIGILMVKAEKFVNANSQLPGTYNAKALRSISEEFEEEYQEAVDALNIFALKGSHFFVSMLLRETDSPAGTRALRFHMVLNHDQKWAEGYPRFLHTLLNNDFPAEVLFDFVRFATPAGEPLFRSHEKNDEKWMQAYLALLSDLHEKGVSSEKILSALTTDTINASGQGIIIARTYSKDTLEYYASLLQKLVGTDVDADVVVTQLEALDQKDVASRVQLRVERTRSKIIDLLTTLARLTQKTKTDKEIDEVMKEFAGFFTNILEDLRWLVEKKACDEVLVLLMEPQIGSELGDSLHAALLSSRHVASAYLKFIHGLIETDFPVAGLSVLLKLCGDDRYREVVKGCFRDATLYSQYRQFMQKVRLLGQAASDIRQTGRVANFHAAIAVRPEELDGQVVVAPSPRR